MNWLSSASVDELGNSLIRSYMGEYADIIKYVDIEGFASRYLNLPIVYYNFAEDDLSKFGFISDGKTPLCVFTGKEKKKVVFPKGTMVIEKYLCQTHETGRRRFTIAHEAAHYIIDKSLATASGIFPATGTTTIF